MGYSQNLFVPSSEGNFSISCSYASITQGIFILVHSFSLHKYRWGSVRTISDLSSVTSVIYSIALIFGFVAPIGAMLLFVIYLLDSLMFINRYFAVKPKVSFCSKILFYVLMSLQFVLWVPEMIFMPITTDLNTQGNRTFITNILRISIMLRLLFNLVCSVVFFLMCRQHWQRVPQQQLIQSSQVVYMTCIKALFHFLVSLLLNTLLIVDLSYRPLIVLLTPTQLHFLFNYRIENNPYFRPLLSQCFTLGPPIEYVSVRAVRPASVANNNNGHARCAGCPECGFCTGDQAIIAPSQMGSVNISRSFFRLEDLSTGVGPSLFVCADTAVVEETVDKDRVEAHVDKGEEALQQIIEIINEPVSESTYHNV